MMLLSEIARAVGGQMQGADVHVKSVGIDSRAIESGELFVAIKGEHFDGNAFAEKALAQGAAAVMVSDKALTIDSSILVDDTRLALGCLAAFWRNRIKAPIVAITGSNGKTTTKEMLTAILCAGENGSRSVHATKGNLNNDYGMPLTLLKSNATHQFVVLEMGMNHIGEIAYLSHIAKPNVAVINNAGTAHIGELGSRENIAKAKAEIFEGLAENGVAVINADNAFADYWIGLIAEKRHLSFGLNNAADVHATYQPQLHKTQLAMTTPNGTFNCELPVSGEHNVYNALAATCAAVALNIPNAQIAKGLAEFKGVYGRLEYKKGLNGAVVIDDTYNANPDSMKAAMQVLSQETSQQKIMVMGDMAELGPDSNMMHAELGAYAATQTMNRQIGNAF
jgi:UDP-N-acetylmuramoyl-tripeptide--D-alanyl-D-alanine ligase